VLDCRIAANFIPYGLANTDKGRNKILRVNDLLARRARAMLPCASLQGRRELVDSHLERPSTAPRTRFGTALRKEEQAHKNGSRI
jgi:hypothetical protein